MMPDHSFNRPAEDRQHAGGNRYRINPGLKSLPLLEAMGAAQSSNRQISACRNTLVIQTATVSEWSAVYLLGLLTLANAFFAAPAVNRRLFSIAINVARTSGSRSIVARSAEARRSTESDAVGLDLVWTRFVFMRALQTWATVVGARTTCEVVGSGT
jgi:hypothetical protein